MRAPWMFYRPREDSPFYVSNNMSLYKVSVCTSAFTRHSILSHEDTCYRLIRLIDIIFKFRDRWQIDMDIVKIYIMWRIGKLRNISSLQNPQLV